MSKSLKWTIDDINKSKISDLSKAKVLSDINTCKKTETPAEAKKSVLVNKISLEKEYIKAVLKELQKKKIIPGYVEELRFHPKRRFRFDWAIPDLKIAIEYEGLISKKSRHTTLTGYSNDTRKYALAVIEGWRVLRYTALTYENIEKDLKLLISRI